MTWTTRRDGSLDLAIVVGYELIALDNDALAIRIEYAENQEQLLGQTAPATKQLVLTRERATELGMDLTHGVAVSGDTKGKA
ncbi:hypothetical protein ASG17_07480 [Brevundimonas sp. Leaf363]|uniref:hypothetical protein n=1 Tax=Brevundimonas sp. Leaf363 TaxID=1736353 RepID=UPI0006F8CFB0|nr:hypothetical protein [Brevundimonas sp. Leaf363]KQS55882.1 hypothetical protein ASG17_07480 [Brevundimonas sp. Leaf363]